MKHFTRAAAALLLAAGTVAPAAQAGAQAPATARNILYRVEGAGGATVYMLGSIHLLTADAYPLAPSVERAYQDAEHVYFEAPLDSLAARHSELMQSGTFPAGRTLRETVPADLYAQVEQAVAPYTPMGLSMDLVNRLEPWMAAMMLTSLEWQKMGLQAQYGVDAHFLARAKRDRKGLGAFESADFQLGLMDGFGAEQQVEMLRQALVELPNTRQMMNEMVAAWRAGDAAAIDSMVNGSMGDPAVNARMLTDRNAAWVPQIERLLRGSDDVLVVVGAAHLVGEQSVVEMLRRRGYTVEQL